MRSVGQEEEGRVKMFTMQNAGKEDDSEEKSGMSIKATRGSHVPGEYTCVACAVFTMCREASTVLYLH